MHWQQSMQRQIKNLEARWVCSRCQGEKKKVGAVYCGMLVVLGVVAAEQMLLPWIGMQWTALGRLLSSSWSGAGCESGCEWKVKWKSWRSFCFWDS